MYNEVLIRRICRQITCETDDQKVSELVSLLRSIIRNDLEEIELRMAFLRKRYATVLERDESGSWNCFTGNRHSSSSRTENYEWSTLETGEVAL